MSEQSEPRLEIPPREYRRDDFEISTDPARLDVEAIHAVLTHSWWAAGVSKETVARSIRASLCFGVYHGSRQIGFGRVISDFATYAYICDDFIVEEFRGRGLGKWLMQTILSHPDLQGLRRWMLIAEDPRIYSRFGFRPVQRPEIDMEIGSPIAQPLLSVS
jgi:GNAT superfamily N-acetyltransferase